MYIYIYTHICIYTGALYERRSSELPGRDSAPIRSCNIAPYNVRSYNTAITYYTMTTYHTGAFDGRA